MLTQHVEQLYQNCFFHLDMKILSVLVVNATLDSEALSIIGEKKNKINLVRVEAQLRDMEIYELIEKMKSSNIPSFVMTAYDDDIHSISQALRTGARWCFRKPVQISELQQLRRFVV